MWRITGYWPQIAETHMKRMLFSEPSLLHLPICRKALNSLSYMIFFNSQKYFWYSDYLPFVANFYITWPLPPTSSEQFSQGHLRCCLLGSKSTWFPPNKPKSQLLSHRHFSDDSPCLRSAGWLPSSWFTPSGVSWVKSKMGLHIQKLGKD